MLPECQIVSIALDVEEVQSLDPRKVIKEKAKRAWEKNNFNPVLVEDSSLEIVGLNNRPGTLVKFFTSEVEMRRIIVEDWLRDKDRRAIARVFLGIYDGKKVYVFEGWTEGRIAESLRGANGFGWDDMFIPVGDTRTFAEMQGFEKDVYSMRRKAIEKLRNFLPVELTNKVFMLPEPFDSELGRVRFEKLANDDAVKFAFCLEAIGKNNEPNKRFEAEKYDPIIKLESVYYRRYLLNNNSASIGLIVTDIDRKKDRVFKNGEPMIWQMGPQRRKLALAQRAEYWLKNMEDRVLEKIEHLDKNPDIVPRRSNKKVKTIERLLGIEEGASSTYSIKEIGYYKISAEKEVSRTYSSQYGLFNRIGKYARSYLGIGSMPCVSGWHDVIVTALVGHMPVFLPRNGVFAENDALRIKLIKQVRATINSFNLSEKWKKRLGKNIGVAIGTNCPAEEVKRAEKYIKDTDISLFRIYTINGDPRVVTTAKALRKAFGHDIEIFVGQIADIKQAKRLVSEANVDGLIFGHGGGRQCTSAINGMAVTTLEQIYKATIDPFFNQTSILVEGGVGRNVGPLLILGVDGILYNQQLVRGTIEIGGIFLQDKQGQFGQPYHGSASAPTMIIEAENEKLRDRRIQPGGRTRVPEGKPGFSRYTTKANSMVFWIDEFRHHLARTLADLGVKDIIELRQFLQATDKQLLRYISSGAAEIAKPYGKNED